MSLKNKLIRLTSIILLILQSPLAIAEDCSPVAKLISSEGVVEVRPSGTGIWQAAKLEQHYCSGDSLRTSDDSRAAVRMINDTLLRLDSGTAITFTKIVKKERSFLEILKGAVHFISRTPRSLEVTTPSVNAAIEGTEFVVRVSDTATDVTVYEGRVVARNTAGSVELAANQTARVETGQPPVRIAVAQPRDAVAWALYYPPLPDQPGPADALARQTIAAIVQNRLDEAAALAEQAIAADPQSATAFMAQSYVNQARFDIPAALANSQKAAKLAPDSALTQARLAEVWLMTGDTRAAQQAAAQAVALDPELSLTQAVLGFASLRRVNLDAARTAFEKAITLDSAAPLPRLGLGLVKIRRGDLNSGREEIETAALLDPNNALLRSYMGKAYYEEKRSRLASEQFAMAKELDPNDPTAWFYDSILLQSENRPVEALQAQQKAIELNDNRGVYRSRQLLDKDNAARDVALGRIYNDLSFEQIASLQATNALAQDPGNHSAHRLLADSYAGKTNLDAARLSELLQSKLTQPLNLDPLQPQLSNANLGLLDGNGPGDLSYNEYNPLFTQNGLALQLDAVVAEQSTWSDDAIIAGLFNRFAFSLGQFHTETDGFRPNADYEQDIYNVFAHFAFSENTMFQVEISEDEETKGDVAQRMLPDLLTNPARRIDNETSSYRVGFNHRFSSATQLQASFSRKEDEFLSKQSFLAPTFPTPPPAPPVFVPAVLQIDLDTDIDLYDVQVKHQSGAQSFLVGASFNSYDNHRIVSQDISPVPITDDFRNQEQTRLYLYYYSNPFKLLNLNGGLAIAEDDSDIFNNKETRILPKLGIRWDPNDKTEIRAAAYRTISSSTIPSLYQTLEPTQIAGFNQIFDELWQTTSWNYGLAIDQQLAGNFFTGFNVIYRDRETPVTLQTVAQTTSIEEVESNEILTNAWLYWTPNPMWGISLEYGFDDFDSVKNLDTTNFVSGFVPDGVLDLKTHRVPLSLSFYHPSGWSSRLSTTYYNQEGKFIGNLIGSLPQEEKDDFWLTDLTVSYRLPKRFGLISIGAKNIFDEDFKFEDRNSYDSLDAAATASPSVLSNERLLFAQFSINFR